MIIRVILYDSYFMTHISLLSRKRRMSTRRSTVPRKIFGRIRLSQFRTRLKKNESEESYEEESTNQRDQRFSQSKVIESIQSRSSKSMNRSFDREMWHRHVANQSEDVDESTNQRRSRRMYRKLFRPSRRRTTRTFNTEQFQTPCKEPSKDDHGHEQSVENVRSHSTKYEERQYVRQFEHEQSEDPGVQMNHNSEQKNLQQEREHTRGRTIVRKTAVQRKATDEQKSNGEKVRPNIDQKFSNDRPNRKISSKIKSREENLVEQNRKPDEQIEKKMKNIRKHIRKSSELLNRSNDSIEKTSEQNFENAVHSEEIHCGSEHIPVVHEQIKQKSEQNINIRHRMKRSNEQNIIESSNPTPQSSTVRRDSGEQLPQGNFRKNSEHIFDNNAEQNKSQRVASIRCISPNSSSVVVNTTSSIEQKRIERSTKNSNSKQTNKRKSTKQKITKQGEQMNSKRISSENQTFDSDLDIDSEHVRAGPIDQKETSRIETSRTKKNEQSREKFEIRIVDSSIKLKRSSEDEFCEQTSSEHFESNNVLDIEASEHVRLSSTEQKRNSKERYGNKKFAGNANDELVRVGSIEQKQTSKEQRRQLKKEKSREQSRSERFNSELETEEVPFVVPEDVPLDVPFYVYSYNSGLTAEPTLSDIYLPSDFSFGKKTFPIETFQLDLVQL